MDAHIVLRPTATGGKRPRRDQPYGDVYDEHGFFVVRLCLNQEADKTSAVLKLDWYDNDGRQRTLEYLDALATAVADTAKRARELPFEKPGGGA